MAPDSTGIRIVLVEPSHPGNIGAVARAMMNMDLTAAGAGAATRSFRIPRPRPALPAPRRCWRLPALWRLLSERLPIAAWSRPPPRASGTRISACWTCGRPPRGWSTEARRAPVALLFGTERTGLSNEDLEASHVLLRIPASREYASLNLAMAVQLVSYEIFRARGDPGSCRSRLAADEATVPLATPPQMQQLYAHLEQVLQEVNFKDRTRAGTHLMSRIRRFLQRAELDQNEVNILRGILTAIQNRRRTAGSAHAPKQDPDVQSRPALPGQCGDHAGGSGGHCADARMPGRGAAGSPILPPVAHEAGRAAAQRVDDGAGAGRATHRRRSRSRSFSPPAPPRPTISRCWAPPGRWPPGRRHVISARTEHKAVLDAIRQLTARGLQRDLAAARRRRSGQRRRRSPRHCAPTPRWCP